MSPTNSHLGAQSWAQGAALEVPGWRGDVRGDSVGGTGAVMRVAVGSCRHRERPQPSLGKEEIAEHLAEAWGVRSWL